MRACVKSYHTIVSKAAASLLLSFTDACNVLPVWIMKQLGAAIFEDEQRCSASLQSGIWHVERQAG
jgi:hypothetical protein